MALCKNNSCRALLGESIYGSGYCSARCMRQVEDEEASDERGYRRDIDAIERLADLALIDARLPGIVLLRGQGKTLRKIAKYLHCDHHTVSTILAKLPTACAEVPA